VRDDGRQNAQDRPAGNRAPDQAFVIQHFQHALDQAFEPVGHARFGRTIGQDYFDELLARIRDIRASERLFYQKITDIYATSIDYDAKAPITQTFFKTVQNKLHWASHGQTAAEVIRARADARQPHMGLTTWKNAPRGPIRKADVTIAKNYLTHEEIVELNRVVSMYLDYAEDQARRKMPMHMRDWAQ
jgi:hypothetical protein